MLTKMPKVGDELRYIGEQRGYLTAGMCYTVMGVDEDGDAYIRDNVGDEYFIYEAFHLREFELVSETPSKLNRGYFDIDYVSEEGDKIRVGLLVDSDGYGTLRDLEDATKNAGKRAELKRKIAELQAELDAL